MKKHPDLSKEEFEALLYWFSDDREEAGREYEQIREGLVRFFRFRGCGDSLTLADETINRVAKRLDTLEVSQNKNKLTIFHGFANFIFKEYLRDESKKEIHSTFDFFLSAEKTEEEIESEKSKERELGSLEKCLQTLNEKERKLLTDYFGGQNNVKIVQRRNMAEYLGISPNALHVRIFRIKERLIKCMKHSEGKKNL